MKEIKLFIYQTHRKSEIRLNNKMVRCGGKKPGKVRVLPLVSSELGLGQGQALCAWWKVLPMCSDVTEIKQSSRKRRKSGIPEKEKQSLALSLSPENKKLKQPAGHFLAPPAAVGKKNLLSPCDLEQDANCFEKVLLSFLFFPPLSGSV